MDRNTAARHIARIMRDIDDIYTRLIARQYPEILFSDLARKRNTASGGIACCPFHDDHNPSFSFSSTKPLWNCFGCGEHGDWIEYLEKRNAFTFQEALDTLAQAAGVELRGADRSDWEHLSAQHKAQAQALSRYFFHDLAMEWFKERLWTETGQEVRDYLTHRGYSHEDIKRMELGYYPGQLETESHLRKQGYSQETIQQFLKWLPWRSEYKLVIPWRDLDDNIIGLWGRLIRPLKEGEKESDKYKPFSTEASKNIPFNLHRTTDCQTLILVEGYFDALTATLRGIEGVVSLGGSSLTQKQLDSLEALNTKNIILALDNDEAGCKGTQRSLEMLKDSPYNVFVVNLPTGVKDPDELLKTSQGVETFRRLLARPQSAAQWQTRHLLSQVDISTPQGKREALHSILSYEVTLKNPFDRQDCVQTYTAALDITPEDIKAIRLELQEKYESQQKQKAYEAFFREGNRLLQEDQLSDTWIDEKTREIQAQTTAGSLVPYRLEDGLQDLTKSLEGMKTGYLSLDHVIRIPQQAMTVVAGRPSHGKTTLLLNLLLNMIEEYPEKAFFFFSYEESKQRLFIKAINILSQVVITQKYQSQNLRQLENFLKGGYTNISQVVEGKQIYANLAHQKRLWLIDNRFYIHDLINQLAYLKDKYDVGAIFIDYIQKVKIAEKAGTRQQEIQRISEQLLDAAINLSLPIVLGAQLGRSQGYSDKVRLDNLREAGDIEQDANLVIGVHNPSVDKKQQEELMGQPIPETPRVVPLELHILKNRDGEVGNKVVLDFDRPILTIRDPENVSNYLRYWE